MQVVLLTKHHSQMDRLQVAAKMRTTASLEQERRDCHEETVGEGESKEKDENFCIPNERATRRQKDFLFCIFRKETYGKAGADGAAGAGDPSKKSSNKLSPAGAGAAGADFTLAAESPGLALSLREFFIMLSCR